MYNIILVKDINYDYFLMKISHKQVASKLHQGAVEKALNNDKKIKMNKKKK